MKTLQLFSILFILFTLSIFAQDAPSGRTIHYQIRMWAENANPSSDSLNQNWIDIDQTLYDLIVVVDSSQMIIENDSLKFSPYMASTDTFTTTATTCTTTVANMTPDDIVVCTPRGTTYDADDALKVSVGTGQFIVTRNSSGTSGLVYNYIWIKR